MRSTVLFFDTLLPNPELYLVCTASFFFYPFKVLLPPDRVIINP